MPEDENRALFQRYFDEANADNLAALDEIATGGTHAARASRADPPEPPART
jgi:hypothetical protein